MPKWKRRQTWLLWRLRLLSWNGSGILIAIFMSRINLNTYRYQKESSCKNCAASSASSCGDFFGTSAVDLLTFSVCTPHIQLINLRQHKSCAVFSFYRLKIDWFSFNFVSFYLAFGHRLVPSRLIQQGNLIVPDYDFYLIHRLCPVTRAVFSYCDVSRMLSDRAKET